MRLAVVVSGALLGLLVAQGTGNGCPQKKSATLLPSFTVTPTATESTARPTTTSHKPTTTGATSHQPTTTGATSHEPTTAGHHATTTPSHGNTTVYPTTNNSTATSPRTPTSTPHPGPPPPPSPSPGSKDAVGDFTWTNGSQPCVRLQAQIWIGILYPTQGGGEAWGTSVLNPNKTKAQGGCESAHPHLLLSFPYGQLSFGFKQEPNSVYLNYVALEYNVSFPQAAQWMFSFENASLRALQAPLGQSLSCGNASIPLSPALHLDLLHLKLQAAQLPPSGAFGPSFPCRSDQFPLLPLIVGLVFLGLLALVGATFCIVRRRPPAYQPL